MRITRLIPLLAALCCAQAMAQGGAFPDRPLKVVVPFAAGGNVDIVARIVATALSEDLRQNVVVENRAGANAIIGGEFVARAAPDGYTLLFGTAETHAINPHLYRKMGHDPVTDLPSVGIVDTFPFALVVNPKLPVASLKEFVEHAKKQPGKLNFASWGVGSTSQIAFEQLKQQTGIDLVHVPFNGAAPAITAVAAGDVEAFMVPLSVAAPQAAAGRIRLLAVTSTRRDASAPELPTATEQGVALVIGGWHVLAVPKGTPPEVMARLNRALNAVNGRPDIQEALAKRGVMAVTSTPQQAQEMVRAEWQRWGQVVSGAGIKAE
jgi:tripartite-type tricarboxylate transporter receptor subunit TctC